MLSRFIEFVIHCFLVFYKTRKNSNASIIKAATQIVDSILFVYLNKAFPKRYREYRIFLCKTSLMQNMIFGCWLDIELFWAKLYHQT